MFEIYKKYTYKKSPCPYTKTCHKYIKSCKHTNNMNNPYQIIKKKGIFHGNPELVKNPFGT